MSTQKRSKSYYAKSTKKAKFIGNVDLELRGFLITCNNRERECLREALDLLSEFADKLYGAEDAAQGDSSESEGDVEDEIKKEVEKLKKQNANRSGRFRALETGAKNVLFIKTTLPDPCELVEEILKFIVTEKQQKCRYILRMLPVLTTCRSFAENIKKASEKILEDNFKDRFLKYSIMFKARNNGSVKRDEVIQDLAGEIRRLGIGNSADLKAPEMSVGVDIVGKICFLSILKNYFQYKKYNLVELGAPAIRKSDENKPELPKTDLETLITESKIELETDVIANSKIETDDKAESSEVSQNE